MFESAMKIIPALSSLRLTLAGMLMLTVGVLVSYFDPAAPVAWMVLPLLLLAVNLLAAVRVNPVIRGQPALLLFHVCLLAVVLLAAGSQLGSLQGRVELTEGQTFSADSVVVVRQGLWHPGERLERLAFTQGPLRVMYNPGLNRSGTESRLLPDGTQQAGSEQIIGDNTPLVMDGYRFYTTSNKGYSALLVWRDAHGNAEAGAVNFPSYPANDWQQLNNWVSPGGEQLGLELVLTNPPGFSQQWTLESNGVAASLHLNVDGSTRVLRPGEQALLADGSLQFVSVRMWMGYEIRYEPLLPWLFGVAVIGVLALAWHFRTRLDNRLDAASASRPRRAEGQHHAVTVARS